MKKTIRLFTIIPFLCIVPITANSISSENVETQNYTKIKEKIYTDYVNSGVPDNFEIIYSDAVAAENPRVLKHVGSNIAARFAVSTITVAPITHFRLNGSGDTILPRDPITNKTWSSVGSEYKWTRKWERGWYDDDDDSYRDSVEITVQFKDYYTGWENDNLRLGFVVTTAQDTNWDNEDYTFIALKIYGLNIESRKRNRTVQYLAPNGSNLNFTGNLGTLNGIDVSFKDVFHVAQFDHNTKLNDQAIIDYYPYVITGHDHDTGNDDDNGNLLDGLGEFMKYQYNFAEPNDAYYSPARNIRDGNKTLKNIVKKTVQYFYRKLNGHAW